MKKPLCRLVSVDKRFVEGGEGSGNFNHAGRPGEVGGSAPGDGSGGKAGGRRPALVRSRPSAAAGTSFHGDEIHGVTASKLTSLFGPPHISSAKGDKTDIQWVLHDIERRSYFTIYNYKNGPAYLGKGDINDIKDWHIGALSMDDSAYAADRVRGILKRHESEDPMIKSLGIVTEGGQGSGNYGHAGIQGHLGGSSPGGEGGTATFTGRYSHSQFSKRAKTGTKGQRLLVGSSETKIHGNLVKFIQPKYRGSSNIHKVPGKEKSKAYVRYYDTMKASGHQPKAFKVFMGMAGKQLGERNT